MGRMRLIMAQNIKSQSQVSKAEAKNVGSIGRVVWIVLIVLGLCTVPFFNSAYLTYMGIRILILSLFALSFNLLLGYTGLLSFGQAAFYAVGGYASGLILIHWTSETLIGILCGTLISGFFAMAVGYFCVKRTRIYFSMLSLAFGMLIYFICYKWKSLTGGTESLSGIPRGMFLGWIDLSPLHHYYYFVLGLVLLATYAIYRIVNSHFGLIIQGIRENENRIRFSGISVNQARLTIFTLSGLFSGLAGGLYACLESTMFPTIADWHSSTEPIMVTLVGGIGSFFGPIMGSFVFVIIKEIIVRFTQEWLLVFGIILLAMVIGFRGGVVGFFEGRFGNVVSSLKR
jgi:branched-chain amino acid transport system permease protein